MLLDLVPITYKKLAGEDHKAYYFKKEKNPTLKYILENPVDVMFSASQLLEMHLENDSIEMVQLELSDIYA